MVDASSKWARTFAIGAAQAARRTVVQCNVMELESFAWMVGARSVEKLCKTCAQAVLATRRAPPFPQ
jgi:hypothetical protein